MPRPKPVKKTYEIYVSAIVESTKFPVLSVIVNGKPLDGGEIRVQELVNTPVIENDPRQLRMFEPEVGVPGGV